MERPIRRSGSNRERLDDGNDTFNRGFCAGARDSGYTFRSVLGFSVALDFDERFSSEIAILRCGTLCAASRMEPWGFEPQISPCHGDVIPFHYGPENTCQSIWRRFRVKRDRHAPTIARTKIDRPARQSTAAMQRKPGRIRLEKRNRGSGKGTSPIPFGPAVAVRWRDGIDL
jgi:hypothetical protein